MSIRLSRIASGLLVVAAIVLMSNHCWAIRIGLGPSKDEWNLKYDVSVQDAGDGKVNVVFTLADEGRLKPADSFDLVAFSRNTDNQGGRSYDAMIPIELKSTEDGKRVGQVQIRKDLLGHAKIRIITHMVDGQRQPSGGAFYDIPLQKFLAKTPGSPLASPPASNVRK